MITINRLPARAGLTWFRIGWQIFRRQPWMLIGLAVTLFVIYFLFNLIPFGDLILAVIMPALSGGYYLALQKTEAGEEPAFADLFAAFNDARRRKPMLTLGAVSLLAQLAMTITSILILGGAFMGAGDVNALEQGIQAAGGISVVLGAGLANLIIALILWMALFFAIPLVMLDSAPPLEALKISLRANFSNLGAWAVFTIILFALLIVAVIPLGLGLLILYPVMSAAMYAAYRQTFSQAHNLARAEAARLDA